MSGILGQLHPTFDALSAYSDSSDVVAARTRVGRHVAGCTSCREVVAEIRGLGEAARAIRAEAAPSDLWLRIRAAASEPRALEPVEPRAAAGAGAPGRRRRLVAAMLTAVAAAVVAVTAWPRTAGLHAAVTSRLTFAPSRPVPGSVVKVRYDAPEWMKEATHLVLVGQFVRPAGLNPSRFAARMEDALADSLGVLTRDADGSFGGTLHLPSNFLAVQLSVLEPVRDREAMDGIESWIIIGGSPTRTPSLASFLAAAEVRSNPFSRDDAAPRQNVDVADSLKRYFPRHPAGWAYSRSYGVSRGRFDLLRFFESADRKYSSLYEELWPRRGLDAERLHDMVMFAHRIDEPAEVLRWAGRLAEEHPEDPRALFDLASALHLMELRTPSSLGDSIRAWLPALDRAYRSAPVPNDGFDDALRLAVGYGDTATIARWRARGAANGRIGNMWMMASRKWAPARDSVATEMRVRAERSCALPAGRLPLARSATEWRMRCEMYRGWAYGYLSWHTLQHARPRQALAEADSAIVAMRRSEWCTPSRAYLDHALAALALGDTATAAHDFIVEQAAYPATSTPMLDSARVHLGPRFDRVASLAGADSARRAARVCIEEARMRRQARNQRLAGDLRGAR